MNRVVVPARQATQPGGIDSPESILELLKSLKIRAQDLIIFPQAGGFRHSLPVPHKPPF